MTEPLATAALITSSCWIALGLMGAVEGLFSGFKTVAKYISNRRF
jgi:hypothetical protein